MPDMDALTYEVEPGLLYGRPGPNKSRWNLEHIKQAGIRVIVSLVPVDAPTKEQIDDLGFRHYVTPFEDKIGRPYRPENDHIYRILEQFEEILDRHLPRKESILVHCNSGKDRTGLLLAHYLMSRKGLHPKRAIRELRRLKPNALTAKGFEHMVYVIARRQHPSGD